MDTVVYLKTSIIVAKIVLYAEIITVVKMKIQCTVRKIVKTYEEMDTASKMMMQKTVQKIVKTYAEMDTADYLKTFTNVEKIALYAKMGIAAHQKTHFLVNQIVLLKPIMLTTT